MAAAGDGALAPRQVLDAVRRVEAAMDALDRARASPLGARPTRGGANTHGGDPGLHRNAGTLVRHTVNYLVAAAAAAQTEAPGPVVDVGAGTGAFSVLLADRLHRPLHVVDTDPAHAAMAAALGLEASVDLTRSPPAAVVTTMEVIEHLRPADQPGFVRALAERVLPGGVLVLSTPDESAHPGGWSGYAPHVGPLDAAGLCRVLQEATGWPVRVVRVGGPAFTLGRVGAWWQVVANRAWTASARLLPLERPVTRAVHRVRRDRGAVPVPPEGSWSVRDVPPGPPEPAALVRQGTGLLAIAVRPG